MSFKRSSFDNDNDNGGGSDGDAPFHKRQRFDDGRGRGRGGRGRGGRGDGFRGGRGDGFRGGRGGGGFRGGRGGFNRFNDDNEGGSDRRGRGGFRGDRGGGFRGRGGGRGRGGNRFDGERGRGRGRGDFRGGRGGFRGDRQFNDNASIIKVQQDAPDFQNISNEKSENISLKQYRGKYVVLFIYFKDNTYGCSSEQKAFRDLKPQFDKLNATILGVSRDDVETHKSAATEANLNFSLLADTEGKISKSYGALDDNDRVTRCTFIIAPDGKVAAVWGKVFGFTEHAQQVLDKLKEIVSGGKETKGDNNDDDNDNDVNQNDDNEANQNDDDDDDDDDDNDNDNNENNDDDDNDDDEDDE